MTENMKLLRHQKLDKMIFQHSEHSIDNFGVSDDIDEISVLGC